MTTTVKAAGAAEFLALVPRMLGYTPRRSVVVVPMGRGRSLGGIRLDLPSGDGPLDGFAATVIGMVCRISRSDGLLAAVYTDEPTDRSLPHRRLAAAIERAADASGLELLDVLVVGPDGWGSHVRPTAKRRELAELQAFDDSLPPPRAGDQTGGMELPPADPVEVAATEAAMDSLERALAIVCGLPAGSGEAETDAFRVDPAALEAACALDDLPGLFEDALTWDAPTLPPLRVAMLAWALSRPSLRDIALVQWATDATGGDDALQAQLRWEDGADYPPDLAAVMWGEGAHPDAARLETALVLVRAVAARTPGPRRAGALAVAAWVSWALGRSTHADAYARAALENEPDHGLADIVRSFVASAHLPDWAFRRGEEQA